MRSRTQEESWIHYISRKLKIEPELLCSLIMNIIVFTFAMVFGALSFETNDDRDFSNIFSNTLGNSENEYAAFINIIFGYMIKPLYRISGTVNWYVVVSIGLSFFAFTMISYTLFKKTNKYIAVVASFAIITLFYQEHYSAFQFTKNATLLLVAGFFGLLQALNMKDKKIHFKYIICSGLLVFFGSLLRFKCLFNILPFIFLICVYDVLIKRKFTFSMEYVKQVRVYVLTFLCVLFLCVAGKAFHEYKYSQNEDWKYFWEYNDNRFELLNYGLPDYEDNKEAFKKLGISEADFELFSKWVYGDPEKFSLETLKAMVAMKPELGISKLKVNKDILKEMIINLSIMLNENVYLIFFVALVGLYLVLCRKKNWIMIVGVLFAFFAQIWYLVCVDRVIHRVTYGLLLAGIVFMMYILLDSEWYFTEETIFVSPAVRRRVAISAIGLMFCIQLPAHYALLEKGHLYEEDDSYMKLMEEAQKNKDILYIFDRPTIATLAVKSLNPVKALPEGCYENVSYSGGWICPTPFNNYALQQFDIANPFRGIAEGKKIYLVDNRTPDMKLEYIQANYNKNVRIKYEKTVGGCKIYSFYTIEEE